ncbi:ribosome assembly cofactor RimP [Flavobacterium aciduliphilum]|uniref:Ribosome maturation factor RimP n=1 Tax=Flavobacterium aciduliphilum TaxID=1101402 RepID=A0A328YI72_9FLAO|nr:ribosome assembly cofactor RimP [Flavobacterium aciduliphilum]RAR72445.1 ribosome maturation factor RimP [Flavobacterium aciduliphilum]
MTFKDQVTKLLEDALQEKPNLFLVDFSISNTNKINIILDGDEGVNLQDCIDVSRAVEHNLDREELDFELEVASVGVGSPLKFVRQYKKNIGRYLVVKTNDQTIEAILSAADDKKITLSWEAREPKKIGKGKETVQKSLELSYNEIKEAIVTIKF